MSKDLRDILPPRCEAQLNITENHVNSFNHFLNHGLNLLVQDVQPVEVEFPDINAHMRFYFESVSISTPCHGSYDEPLYPGEVNCDPLIQQENYL